MSCFSIQRVIISGLIILGFLLPLSGQAKQLSWRQWLSELKIEAVQKGIEPQLFDDVFRGVRPNKRVLHFDRTQPEKRLTFKKYRRTRADAYRIRLGQKKFRRYQPLLEEVQQKYGVDACFIVSIWGLESSYGHFMGSFSVIKSLATLAYDKRRSEFFRRELLIALRIVQDGHISSDRFKGEWAGASGQSQFLPSSWRRYAVDYDGDGRKDIWTTHGDVFASIANYLASNGWGAGQPWAEEIRLPRGLDQSLIDNKEKKLIRDWQQLGIRKSDGSPLDAEHLEGQIVIPYGGPSFMAYPNFRVLQTYNRSKFYVGTVGYMAEKICKREL